MIMLSKLQFSLGFLLREITILNRQLNFWLSYFSISSLGLILFPFVLPFSPDLMLQLGPGLIWLWGVFTWFILVNTSFKQDLENKTVLFWFQSPIKIRIIILLKISLLGLIFILSLLILLPLSGILYNLSWNTVLKIFFSLIIASPSLALISALATILGIKNNILAIFLLIPLILPIIIFGNNANMAILVSLDMLNLILLPKLLQYLIRSQVIYII